MLSATITNKGLFAKSFAKSIMTKAFISMPMAMLAGLVLLPTLASAIPLNDPSQSSSHDKQYKIEDFSDDYYALITPMSAEDIEAEEFSEVDSIITVIEAKSKRTLIRQPAWIDIDYELGNSRALGLGDTISANIVSLPYGEHSVLIYDDFNFDGQKDLAIQDGRYGCYGGTSYQIYLKEGNTFKHSEPFSELTHGNCGFFDIDEDQKTLHTMTKSGAAWHEYSTYKVIDNIPVAVHRVEEEYNARGLISITESTRVNDKMVVETYDRLPYYDETQDRFPYIYGFELDNGKKLVIDSSYGVDGERLYYAFADKDGRIELLYDGPFDYDRKTKTLSFTNKPMIYSINRQGIQVQLPNKTVMLKSQPATIKGNLGPVVKFNNVSVY